MFCFFFNVHPWSKFDRLVFCLHRLIPSVTCRGALLHAAADALIVAGEIQCWLPGHKVFYSSSKCNCWKCWSAHMNFVTETKTVTHIFLLQKTQTFKLFSCFNFVFSHCLFFSPSYLCYDLYLLDVICLLYSPLQSIFDLSLEIWHMQILHYLVL